MISLLKRGIACLFLLTNLHLSSYSQDFAGLRTSNYAGVNGVFFNPANIAGSPYRWDVNIGSANFMVGNNMTSYRLKDMIHTFNSDTLKARIAGAKTGIGSAMVSTEALGPSFMFNAGKSAFAFTTRVRIMENTKKMDGKLLNEFVNEKVDDPSLPYDFTVSGDNRVNANAWTEFGVSFGQVLVDDGPHFFKAGITLKYLAGVGNAYLQMDNTKGTLNSDPSGVYLSQMSGTIGVNFGGTTVNDIKNGHLGGLSSSGFGGDIGFVYEYRYMPDVYKLRMGIALLDVGSIRYARDASRTGVYSAHVPGTERLYVNEFGNVDNYRQFMDSHPQYFTAVPQQDGGTYNVSLPTTLQVDLDYRLAGGLFANVSGQLSLAGDKPYNSSYYNMVAITPRWEGRHFGIFLPMSYNTLSNFNAGFSAHLGPLYFGSGSVLSAWFKDAKQADFFVGVRFGGLKRD
jgi:hypothetical protein